VGEITGPDTRRKEKDDSPMCRRAASTIVSLIASLVSA
jgi:hypothetical protein